MPPLKESEASASSYSRILKTSTITGSAHAVTAVVRAVRVKLVAILLGPEGVGLFSLYQSAFDMLGKATEAGLSGSGIRQIADASANRSAEELAKLVQAFRRTLFGLSVLGCLITILAAPWLNQWVFDGSQKALWMAVLGFALLFRNLQIGQEAVLRGARRIGDLAQLQIATGVATTLVFLAVFSALGSAGIAWALLASAASNWAISTYFFRRVRLTAALLTFAETVRMGKGLLALGLAFLWAGFAGTAAALLTRVIIVESEGMTANGLYQAGWGVSGMLATFIFAAMGADFYPRLSAAAKDNAILRQLVNEQTEVALLLALPGLLATIALSPWLIQIFYTGEFSAAASLIPLFAIGIFAKALSWPAGFLQLAKAKSLTFATTETLYHAIHLSLVLFGVRYFGIAGAATAYAIAETAYIAIILVVVRRSSGYQWSGSVIVLASLSTLVLAATLVIVLALPETIGVPLAICISLVIGLLSLNQLVRRLGQESRISRLIARTPLARFFR